MVTDSGPHPPPPGGLQPDDEPGPGQPHGPAADEPGGSVPGEPAEGGETACWAHLVCPECGAMTTEGHRPSCRFGSRDSG
jgi:hypothetical protein